jgi:hypothetical protein
MFFLILSYVETWVHGNRLPHTAHPRLGKRSFLEEGAGIIMKKSLGSNQVRADETGRRSGQVGPRSAGQSGRPPRLSRYADASEESVEKLADTDQASEAAALEGSQDAADHPERPTHTHLEYPRPDDSSPGGE